MGKNNTKKIVNTRQLNRSVQQQQQIKNTTPTNVQKNKKLKKKQKQKMKKSSSQCKVQKATAAVSNEKSMQAQQNIVGQQERQIIEIVSVDDQEINFDIEGEVEIINNDNLNINNNIINNSQNQQQQQQQIYPHLQEIFNPEYKGKYGFEDFIQQNQKNDNPLVDQCYKMYQLVGLKKYIYCIEPGFYYEMISYENEKFNSVVAATDIIEIQFVQQQQNPQREIHFIINGKDYINCYEFYRSFVGKIQIRTKTTTNMQNTTTATTLIDQKKKNNKNKVKKLKKSNVKQQKQQKTIGFNKNVINEIINILNLNLQEQQSLQSFFNNDIATTDFSKNYCTFICNHKLKIIKTTQPFKKIKQSTTTTTTTITQSFFQSNQTLLILGQKNTGKSTLAQYFLNSKPQSVCVLDCDIGRSLTFSGCISLITPDQNYNIWIGEYTPLNCLQKYKKAMVGLYQLYRQKYFTMKLVINTMGYLTGIGQMVIYEIYALCGPRQIVWLKSPASSMLVTKNVMNNDDGNNKQQVNTTPPTIQKQTSIKNIIYNLQSGKYLQRLYFSSNGSDNKIQKFSNPNHHQYQRHHKHNNHQINNLLLSILQLQNIHTHNKGNPIRFQQQNISKNYKIKNIIDLITLIKLGKFKKIVNDNSVVEIYQQDKYGNCQKHQHKQHKQQQQHKILFQQNNFLFFNNKYNMRIILLGKRFKTNQENIQTIAATTTQISTNIIMNQPQPQPHQHPHPQPHQHQHPHPQPQSQPQPQKNLLIQIIGIGYQFEGNIYYDNQTIYNQIKQKGKIIGLVCQNVDFQKFFYQTNELKLIQFQLQFGQAMYLAPIIKGLGSKGVKIKPAKAL